MKRKYLRRTDRTCGTCLLALSALVFLTHLIATGCTREPELHWWKGNTHTHTLWSDGNAAPELVADWYHTNGYNFLMLSDHNILSVGEKWYSISEDGSGRLSSDRLEELKGRFGTSWPEIRSQNGTREMRLRTLSELRDLFETPGEFLFIQGEEISDKFDEKPVHVNGMHLAEVIPPQGGDSMQETLQRNVNAVIEQGRRLNRPTLAHINHPNFGWALTPEDVAAVRGDHFFEVYNGHSSVRNYGDEEHPGMEELWDIALVLRLTELDLGPLYGLATDDAHEYFNHGIGNPNPGRGWVMVRSPELTVESIVEALRSGSFYASSGVVLDEISYSRRRLVVKIHEEERITYITQFIGTKRRGDVTGPVGEVLFETGDNPAIYRFRGDELYVRARIVSSKLHPNPYVEGDHESAWVQPAHPDRPVGKQ